jgi:hypothetical protein
MRLRVAVLASALTVLGAVVTPGVTAAAPHHNRGLTINATPNPILAGDGVLIYGQLNRGTVAGQTIRLFHRVNPRRHFSFVASTTTDSHGFYEFTRAEGVVMTNRSWFVTGPNAAHSRTIRERVAALVTVAANQTNSDTNHPIVFSGRLTPNHRFEPVVLQEQRGASDEWKTLEPGLIGAGSNYSISYRFRMPGVHNLRVMFPGDRRNTRGISDPVTVTIQQAQIPGFTINTSDPIRGDGRPVTISGVLFHQGTTTPEPNTVVQLLGRSAFQGHFTVLADTTTGADGSYAFKQAPRSNTVYQVRTAFAPIRHSATLFEGVRDVLTIIPSSTTSEVGQRVVFAGTVIPDKAGDPIYLERLGKDGQWHVVEVRFVRGNSTYLFTWTFGTAGTKTFRARVPGDPANVGGASPAVSIAVSPAAVSSLPPAS